ncbi:hypothetical protein N7472_011142 [Penicillium cf. griseofulvum]|uniref:Uncharacterized protein n=1 Tax=Penicillium cf. griseofulvum TaxID=2972120 RepID=A0A9W9INT0_9EURO|nr:hypothetical protein N7472_011142 [Penicillium cf. griseofulvum]
MDNRPRHSAFPGSSGLPQEGITEFTNEPTGTNESTGTNHPVEPGPSQWSPSYPTLEILQAHLAADADSDVDSDAEEAAGPRVHPDFFVHLQRLQSVNEANRVNARREADAQFQAHQTQLALSESQNQASMMLNESQHESPQVANRSNQPWYDAGEERLSQSSPMGSSERHGTQAPTTAGPFLPIWQVPYETSDPVPAHPRDRSSEHRILSPNPVPARRRAAAGPSPLRNPPTTAEPERPRYTEHGNPYTLAREPPLISDDVVPCAPERMLQTWLIRQQLIAGVRPEDLQPMSHPSGRRQRTPPWIMFNDSGAHIIRIDPARFHGIMLPMPDLPWFPRRADPNSSTALVSTNAPASSDLSTAPNFSTALSSTTPNPPVAPGQPTVPTSMDSLTLPDAPDIATAASSLSTLNSPVSQDLSVPHNSPVDSNQSDATDPPVDRCVRGAAAFLAAMDAPTRPAVRRQFGVSDPLAPLDDQTLPDAPDMAAAPNSVSILNPPVVQDLSATPNPPVASNLLAVTNQPFALTQPTVPTSLDDQTLPDAPDIATSVSSLSALNSPVSQDLSVPHNSPVDSNQSDATDPPVDRYVRGAAAFLAALDAPTRPAARRHFDVSDPLALLDALTMPAPNLIIASNPTSVPEQSLGDPSQHVVDNQSPDPRVVAFFQPLRLHEPTNSTSSFMWDTRPEGSSTSESAYNESSPIPAVDLLSQSHTTVPLAVQNRTDADSISSREAPRVGVSPAHSQDRISSTVFSLSSERTETGHVSAPETAHNNVNGNGVVSHEVLWSHPGERDDPYEPVGPRLRRFLLDGADDSLGAGRLSGESKAPCDQSSFGGLI